MVGSVVSRLVLAEIQTVFEYSIYE